MRGARVCQTQCSGDLAVSRAPSPEFERSDSPLHGKQHAGRGPARVAGALRLLPSYRCLARSTMRLRPGIVRAGQHGRSRKILEHQPELAQLIHRLWQPLLEQTVQEVVDGLGRIPERSALVRSSLHDRSGPEVKLAVDKVVRVLRF